MVGNVFFEVVFINFLLMSSFVSLIFMGVMVGFFSFLVVVVV